jgi:hypothetical protein
LGPGRRNSDDGDDVDPSTVDFNEEQLDEERELPKTFTKARCRSRGFWDYIQR